jgi:hypothetical protein
MNQIIVGYPLYIYIVNISFQFVILPLLSVAYNRYVYNTLFTMLMMKDLLVITSDTLMNLHHGISIVGAVIFCNSQQISFIVTVAEIGSGTYNIYTLAKHYDYYQEHIFWIYATIMTISNIYCIVGITKSKFHFLYKIPFYILMFMRQYYIITFLQQE